MTDTANHWDVAIVGGGMAGLTAAITASAAGARTLILEKEDRCGGNAALSAGMFLGSSDYDGLHAYIPDGDPALQRMMCADFLPALGWLESQGMPLAEMHRFGDFRAVQPMGLGQPGDRRPWLDAYEAIARRAGVEIRTGAALTALESTAADLADSGFDLVLADRVFSLVLADGAKLTASAVILTTGGFQGDAARLAAIIGPDAAAALFLRSRPGSAGDGLRLAESAGAATAGDMGAFYGHTIPDIPLQPNQWQPLTPYFSRGSALINRDGRRFTDEGAGLLEETNAQDGCRQPGGVYWLVFDRGILDDPAIQGTAATIGDFDWVTAAREAGAQVFERATLEALADDLTADGVDRSGLDATLAAYNAACRAGDVAGLDPPRSDPFRAIGTPPYYAVRCRAAITGTTGGIAIDAACQVKAADGAPIPGLYAAGVDAGGYFGRTYNGFLGWSLVSGRRAGLSAAQMAADGTGGAGPSRTTTGD